MLKVLVGVLVSLIATSSFATANLGLYEGVTTSGENCSVRLENENKTYLIQMAYENNGHNEGCGFYAHSKTEGPNKLRIGGGTENSVCKIAMDLANDGSVVSAKMGIGNYFQFGYDVECTNLHKVN